VTKRRIVVTGGTAGIGFAIAKRLLLDGHSVFICGHDAERLQAAIASLAAAAPDRVHGKLCDVRRLQDVQDMIAAARSALGGVDGLINNAGVAFIEDFESVTPEQWSEIIDTNLTGVFNCCHAALPALKEAALQGPSDIINVGSRSGRYSFKGGTGYNTTKFGLQGFTEALFLDLSRIGIRVGLIAPGTVATGLGGTSPQDWHLRPDHIAHAISAMLDAEANACMNWIEIRPSRPPA